MYKDYYTNQLTKNNDIYISFLNLHTQVAKLENEIFKANYYLYVNNDNIIRIVKKIDNLINKIKKDNRFNSKIHKSAYKNFLLFEKSFKSYKENLYDFLKYNGIVKNSVTYIPTLTLKSFSMFDAKKDIKLITFLNKIESEILIAKNAKDYSFISDLKEYLKELQKISKNVDPNKKEFLEVFERHLDIFIEYFPKSTKLVEKLSDNSFERILDDETMVKFKNSTIKELNELKFYDWLFTTLYILSILIIIFFIFFTEKRKRELKKLNRSLQEMLVTDSLTKLKNRFSFSQDKQSFKEPVLILINIDGFKNINEFYGNSFGDKVLIEFSKKVQLAAFQILNTKKSYIYRFGSDNFGILFEKDSLDLAKTAKRFLEKLDNIKIAIDGIEVDIFTSLGISSSKKRLFETAEMALKRAKQDLTKKFYIFSKEIDKTKEIEKNLNQLKELKFAIRENKIVPYFQPIIDLKTKKTVKYEALARIVKDDNTIVYPKDFLPAAKSSKLIGDITKIVLQKTIKKIVETKNHFSVNITYEDIEDEEDRKEILKIISKNRDASQYLTIEILEDEQIANYALYDNFINEVKLYGCHVAIDDFGSGYSNFDRVLKLKIDTIKIDGSLIKNIDKDKKSLLVVSTIVDFAKKANIEIVAEFVHSKEVLETVKNIGIDQGQGYFLGKPTPII